MIAENDPVAARAQAAFQQGFVLHQEGRLAQAQEIYQKVLQMQPGHVDALHFAGLIAYQTGNFLQAVELIGRAVELNPQFAAAHSNRGLALQELKRLDEALDSYDHAIKLNPDNAEAYSNRGNVLRDLQRLEEAVDSCCRAIELKPDYAEAYSNRGIALKELNRLDEALDSYDRALELKPDVAEAHNNRGFALHELQRLDEALDSYDRALELKPDFAEAYTNRGNVLRELKRLDEALASFERAISLKPDFPEGHWNLSLCRLLMGDFARGLEGYEWRWRTQQFKERRNLTQRLWLGEESLQGKTILLQSEQGLGDALLFCRYARLASDLGARVILEVPGPLLELLADLAGVAQLVARGSALPAADFYCPLMSLPLAFKTDLNTIPFANGYIRSRPGKVAEWRKKLGDPGKLRVGLSWSGSVAYSSDAKRSVALSDIVRHLPGQYQYFSLQKDIKDGDREVFDSHANMVHFGAGFADTAALCELMDVVISVDTSIAHLAGAMGKPVWVLLPFIPDWRWLLDREDSVWYSSARLFRQDQAGGWAGVIDRIRAELLRQERAMLSAPGRC